MHNERLTAERLFYSRLPYLKGFSLLLIPLLDVLFNFLLFIVLGATLIYAQGIMVDPPTIEGAQFNYADKLVITMKSIANKDGSSVIQIFFNNQAVQDYHKLENLLLKIVGPPESRQQVTESTRLPIVLLRADKQVPFEDIAQIMGICQRNELRLFIITKNKR